MKLYKLFSSIILILSLAGCGFHLRGITQLPPQLHTLYLSSNNPYTPFMHQLRTMLKLSHITLVSTARQAPVRLHIDNENADTHETSVGGSQTMRNYIATYSITYMLYDSRGHLIYGPKTISTQQDITILSNEILSSSNKLTVANNTMRQNLVTQLEFQLQSKSIKMALKQIKASSPKQKHEKQH